MGSNNYYGIIHRDSDILMDELIGQNIKYDLILTDPPYNIIDTLPTAKAGGFWA